MNSFLSRLSDGFANLEKCGDVVVSPKDNTIGLYCHFCCDIYTNLLEFLHHLHWMHSDVLAFTNEHNVYSVEELLCLPSPPQTDVQSQTGSSDSGLPADAIKTNCGDDDVCYVIETKTNSDTTNNQKVLQWQAEAAAAAEPHERDVLAEVQAMLFEEENNTEKENSVEQEEYHGLELQQMLQAAGLQNIKLELEHPMSVDLIENNVAVDIKAEATQKSSDNKVNYGEKESETVRSKPNRRQRETVKRNSEKLQTNLDLKSYAIGRTVRRREQHQRFSNIKKRIFRSLENEPTKSIHKHIKKSNSTKLNLVKSENVQLFNTQANLQPEEKDKTKIIKEIKAEVEIKTYPTQKENINIEKESELLQVATNTAKQEEDINKKPEVAQLLAFLKTKKSLNIKTKIEKILLQEKNASIKQINHAARANQTKELEKSKEKNSKSEFLISETSNLKEETKNISKKRQSVLINKIEILPANKSVCPTLYKEVTSQISVDKTLGKLSSLEQSQPALAKVERVNQQPLQSPQRKRKQIDIDNLLQKKKIKTDSNLSHNETPDIDLTDSAAEVLQNDSATSSKSDSLTELVANTLKEVQVEKELKEQKAEGTRKPSTESELNTAPKEDIRIDISLLKLVGLPVLKEPNYEDLETVEYCDALRSKAAKFSELLRQYDTVWNPKRCQPLFIQKTLKQLLMFKDVINSEFKADLNVSELKRILNLINAWHVQQVDLKFFKKVELSSTVDHYLQLFAFLPKINRCLYYCEWCEESCSNKSRYEKHRLVHMCTFTCPHCERGFKKRGYLNNHVRIVHGQEK